MSVCTSLASHHINDELIDVEVGLLLHAADDTALDGDASTLHLQAGGVNAGHLEAFEVANAPRQDLTGTKSKQSSCQSDEQGDR